MLHQFRTMSIKAYMGATSLIEGFTKELKEDERGLDGIVIAVLLVLVGVLAVVLLWDNLKGWLDETWAKIQGQADGIN